MVDIVMITYFRRAFTEKVLNHLFDRTPNESFRLIVVDNGSTDGTPEMLREKLRVYDELILLPENYGLEYAKNIGLDRVTTPRFIDTDNDCLVPLLDPPWIDQLNGLMDTHPEFGAIALRCQIHVGVGPLFKDAPEVKEFSVAGGSMRLMDTALVRGVGGWRDEKGQNRSEEWHISNKLRAKGKKVGYSRDIFTHHMFGEDHKWGYGEYDHKHGNRSCPYVDSMFNIDPITCIPDKKYNQ